MKNMKPKREAYTMDGATMSGPPVEKLIGLSDKMINLMLARIRETGADECTGCAFVGGLRLTLRIKLVRGPEGAN
jgi:hypothetical protein